MFFRFYFETLNLHASKLLLKIILAEIFDAVNWFMLPTVIDG